MRPWWEPLDLKLCGAAWTRRGRRQGRAQRVRLAARRGGAGVRFGWALVADAGGLSCGGGVFGSRGQRGGGWWVVSAAQLAVDSMRREGRGRRRVLDPCRGKGSGREAETQLRCGSATRRSPPCNSGAWGVSLSRSTRAVGVAGGGRRAGAAVRGGAGWCGWRWWLRGGLAGGERSERRALGAAWS